MKAILHTAFIMVFAVSLFAAEQPAGQPQYNMDEGFFLDGVEGVLAKSPDTENWSFVPGRSIKMAKYDYPAGKPLPILPCSVLEQMTGLAQNGKLDVRLWGMATAYKHESYLYAVYFLPLKGTVEQPEQTEAKTKEPAAPETESIIPADILKQLSANAAPDLQKFQQVADVTGDMNLIGRSGFLQQRGRESIFVPDGFGRNVDLRQFKLLPGTALETAEKEMNKTPGRQRYTVSGLVTNYKGQTFILLRRAERTFTHGNFTP